MSSDHTDEHNYFRMVGDEDRIRTYDGLVWVQLARCCFTGSQDTTNVGKVWIHDEHGNIKEIVRTDWRDSFLQSVNILYALCEIKIRGHKPGPAQDYDEAKERLRFLIEHLRKDGIFGYKNLVPIWGPDGEAD